MTGTHIKIAALLMAGMGMFIAASGEAHARYRCRQGWGMGWRQSNYTNGYASNVTYNNGYTYGTNVNTTSTPAIVNGSTVQPNGTYAVSKPVVEPAPVQPVVIDQAPNRTSGRVNALPNQPISRPGYPVNNASPDADNAEHHLTTSAIPGTSPAKAPAPAAAAVAPQQ